MTAGRGEALVALAVVCVLSGCGDARPPAEPDASAVAPALADDDLPDWTPERVARVATLSPLPERAPADPTNRWSHSREAAALGRRLLDDPRLSATGARACTTCHVPARDWTDGLERPEPVLGEDSLDLIDRNTQSLWNVGLQRWVFWDGASDTLWGAAIRHLEDRAVMGGTRLGLVQRVGGDDELRDLYERAFGPWTLALDELPAEGYPGARPVFHPHREAWDTLGEEQAFDVDATAATIGKAFDAALRELVSSPTRFDAFVAELQAEGASDALTPSEQRGLALFVDDGCVTCHAGPALSDGAFHDADVRTREGGAPDFGRLRGIQSLLDDTFVGRGVHGDASPFHPRNREVADLPTEGNADLARRFRTPSLRRVAGTAPYMHDGRYATLTDVLAHYMRAADLLGLRAWTADERDDVLAFLETL